MKCDNQIGKNCLQDYNYLEIVEMRSSCANITADVIIFYLHSPI